MPFESEPLDDGEVDCVYRHIRVRDNGSKTLGLLQRLQPLASTRSWLRERDGSVRRTGHVCAGESSRGHGLVVDF